MLHLCLGVLVGHRHLAAHAVELEVDVAGAVLVEIAQPQVFDDQGLAVLNVDLVGLAQGHAVEEHMAAHAHDVAVLLPVAEELLHHLGVEAPGDDVLLRRAGVELLHLPPGGGEVDGLQQLTGAAGDGLLTLEHHLLQVLGEAPGGLAHHALEVAHHAVGEGEGLSALHNVLGGQLVLHHEDGQITHHLGGGRHLHNVAQHVVDLDIHLLDVLELVAQAQALHLALEVGVLAARHLVAVDIGGGVLDARLKLAVAQAHVRPVVGEGLELFGGESGVPLLALEGGDHRVQGGLAGGGGHGVDGAVHNIHPCLGGHQIGGHLVARGVVGVQVDGQAHLVFQGSDQLLGRVGLEEAGHVLDAQQMGAPLLQLLGHVHVVFEGIFIPLGVENVTGVAQGGLAQLALLEHLVYGYLHAGNPVQGVEDTEYVDAAPG